MTTHFVCAGCPLGMWCYSIEEDLQCVAEETAADEKHIKLVDSSIKAWMLNMESVDHLEKECRYGTV